LPGIAEVAQDQEVRGVSSGDLGIRRDGQTGGEVERELPLDDAIVGLGDDLIIDRPRCVTLIVSVPGEPPVRRRVALGGRC